jgi:hypothetical protein
MKKLNKSLTFTMVFAITVLSASFSVYAAELNSVKNYSNSLEKTTHTIANLFDKHPFCRKHPIGCSPR